MEKVKANIVAKFRALQFFIYACTVYYGDGFDDYLKQVRSVYPNLDLFKISMDDPVLTTPTGSDTVSEESNNSTYIEEQVPKDDSVVIAQPVPDGVVAFLVSSIENPLPKGVENPSAQDAQNPSS